MLYLDVAQQHKDSCYNSKFVHLPLPMKYFLPMTKMQGLVLSIWQKIQNKIQADLKMYEGR